MAAAIKNTKRLLISVILWFSFLIIFHRSIEENLFWALKAGESHLPDSLKEQLPKLFCDTCNEHSPKDLQTYQHSIPDIGTDPWDMGPDSPEPKLFSRPQFKPSQKEAASDIRELGFDSIPFSSPQKCPRPEHGPIDLITQGRRKTENIRLLINVMSSTITWERTELMRRAYRRLSQRWNVDIIFLVGNVPEGASPEDDAWQKYGSSFVYLRRVWLKFGESKYTHVMATDEKYLHQYSRYVSSLGSFSLKVLIVGIALLQVLRTNSVEKEIYWTGPSTELEGTVLGSGYILSLGLVKWIAISMPSPVSSTWSTAHHFESCLHSHLKRFQVVNETAYASEKRRWTLVTQNLKQDSAWEETASYYLNLEWA